VVNSRRLTTSSPFWLLRSDDHSAGIGSTSVRDKKIPLTKLDSQAREGVYLLEAPNNKEAPIVAQIYLLVQSTS
jgi:hypothetical protein